ncbi:hypothetical protein LZ554_001366 [Drepanopeziza brunnea f. sp. 'monogermtubi']|nr:hypothetical protein LZ554_001366 [Drepanopeziza brunnea f. sp. 'monogermtubi']
MQKVFKHTIMAEKQAARRLAKKKDKFKRDAWRTNREQNQVHRKDEINTLKAARFTRREDYELGPLAPRRDVGDKKDSYGTVDMQRMQGRTLYGKEKWDILNFWGGKRLNLAKQDRVVLLEGRDKGKIGKVTEIDMIRAECTVEGLNMMDISVPSYMVPEEAPDKRLIRTIEQPISLKSVRLVHPLPDPETGVVRDVIIKKLVSKYCSIPNQRKGYWIRIIPGLNIKVPFPKTAPKEHVDCEGDTLPQDVDAKTFVPSLLTPPMPGSVIDELRNKYSVFRTRHEPEYIARKEREEEEKEARKKLVKKMRTPLNEANRKARKERKKLGKGTLTPEMLEKIGQVIASKRNLALEGAGMEKVDATPMSA